jgi:acetolactate decarboxylase
MLKGKMELFRWHVINWPESDTVHTHQKHMESGLHATEENREVTILGFYSRHHQGIYTHHTSHMHLHVLSDDLTLAGHLDQLAPGNDFKIFLPSVDE